MNFDYWFSLVGPLLIAIKYYYLSLLLNNFRKLRILRGQVNTVLQICEVTFYLL